MKIGGKVIGGASTYIVAEMSANHKQIYQKAAALVYAAKNAGADAIKVQLFNPADLTLECANEYFVIEYGPWAGRTLWELYSEAAMPLDWAPRLKELADQIGIDFFATVYTPEMVDFSEKVGVCAYKIASFEIGQKKLLKRVAQTGKPVIISTGQADFTEIWAASRVVQAYQKDVAFLHCCSCYPAKAEQMSLRTILDLSRQYRGLAGLSDHTKGYHIAVAAVALGARIIEKHLTLDNDTLDAAFSLKPREFAVMADAIRDTEAAMGTINFGCRGGTSYKRSQFATTRIKTGDTLDDTNTALVRAVGHYGIPAGVAKRDYEYGEPIGEKKCS